MDDLIVERKLCVGSGACTNGESFGSADLKIKDDTPELHFIETSSSGADWSITNNLQSSGSPNAFSINHISDDISPFVIEDGAPDNAVFINEDGQVGIGTSLPLRPVHIVTDSPGVRLDSPLWAAKWDMSIVGPGGHFDVSDPNSSVKFRIEKGAPLASLFIKESGNTGLGTAFPAAPLELSRGGNFNFFRITATGAPVNESVDFVFTKGALDTGELRYNIVEAADSPQVPEMTLNANGDMVLTGTLTTSGPTCAAGCDRVFDVDYALPTIADHAEQMFASGHLPSIGATVPHAPVNLSERQGNIINSLEHAHIYINQLNSELADVHKALAAVQSELELLRQ